MPHETIQKSEPIVFKDLLGSLRSPDELIIDPRVAVADISRWLTEKYGVEFLWGKR